MSDYEVTPLAYDGRKFSVRGLKGFPEWETFWSEKEAVEAAEAHIAMTAARKAKLDAYAARGWRVLRSTEGLARAQIYRGMHKIVVEDAEGNRVAEYANLGELPELDPAETTEVTETDNPAETEAKAEPAPMRGTITDAQAELIIDLIRVGRHEEGGFFAGPTTEAGVWAMSREDASAYIDSLTDNY